VFTLRFLPLGKGIGGHQGELLSCAYSPDGVFVLSGGWDGSLRLWEASSGTPLNALPVSTKPVSACAITPDGKQWLSGTLEGMLAFWDPMTQRRLTQVLAHTRPVSSVRYSPDGKLLATTSWDKNVVVWSNPGKEGEGRTFSGHVDLVAGCAFGPDGRVLLSWSHDQTLRLWDVRHARELALLAGHRDRIVAAAVSVDGSWALSGSRDRILRLWSLGERQTAHTRTLPAEPRACFFLPDGETTATVDADGVVRLFSLRALELLTELETGLAVQCSELSPGGDQLVIGCTDGSARFVDINGLDDAPLLTTATPAGSEKPSVLGRLFGKGTPKPVYSCTCPACHRAFDVRGTLPRQPGNCPSCRRALRIRALARV
jgi:WD40 repeat protein